MATEEDADEFIRSTFPTVWSLEVLLYLSRHAERSWSKQDIVDAMRASELIVSKSLHGLVAAGLVSIDADGCAIFAPASDELTDLFETARERYRRNPNTVRRLILSSASTGITAFADAFKFRKD